MSLGLPKAYNIRRISSAKICQITRLPVKGDKSDIIGFAEDITSGELSFIVYQTSYLYTVYKPQVGDTFSYSELPSPPSDKRRMVKLLEKIVH
jgi:hypothetical protein